jgi:hypothetical protein
MVSQSSATLSRIAFGRDIIDTLQLPKYDWPALAPTAG